MRPNESAKDSPSPASAPGEDTAIREALRWLLHLCHDVGKAGGKPEDGEWEAAIAEAESALRTPRADTGGRDNG